MVSTCLFAAGSDVEFLGHIKALNRKLVQQEDITSAAKTNAHIALTLSACVGKNSKAC